MLSVGGHSHLSWKWLLVKQFFSGRNQLGWLNAECARQLEDGRDGRLVLAGFNQGDEITLNAGLKPKLLLAQAGSQAKGTKCLPKSSVRRDCVASRHMGKLSFFL